MTSRRTYTLAETAAEIGVSVKTVRREIRDGNLGARRVRGVVRVLASELDRYLNDAPQIVSAVPLRVVEPSGRQRVTRLVAIG